MNNQLTVIIPTVSENNFKLIKYKLETLDKIEFSGKVIVSFNGVRRDVSTMKYMPKNYTLTCQHRVARLPAFEHFALCASEVETSHLMFSADDDEITEWFSEIDTNLYKQRSITFFPVSCEHGASQPSLVTQNFIGTSCFEDIINNFSDLHFYGIYRKTIFKILINMIDFNWAFCTKEFQHRRKAYLFALGAYSLKRGAYIDTTKAVLSFKLKHGVRRKLEYWPSIFVDIQLILKMTFLIKKRKMRINNYSLLIFGLRRIKHGFFK